ncbi:hypothetical protein M0812_23282 [Anaeramoeba flamelloides]|uniref:Uncharacterized protein n=1 Tax=Anaeramoeba flamelloides TaxID=1746091 RepID=A0AAV7YMT9_9EUKA|nr:hypothetical protein M0812_23282 [Anaeramoeba flamelloides]
MFKNQLSVLCSFLFLTFLLLICIWVLFSQRSRKKKFKKKNKKNKQSRTNRNEYHCIRFIDKKTQNGIPLVCLTTTNDQNYYTDSDGYIAFYEPGLMNTKVYFHIKSDGYKYPKDFFGYEGVSIKTVKGGSTEIGLERTMIAERIYRVTGQGIFRDSILLNKEEADYPPIISQVMGLDSVQTTIYRNKMYWFWGDTNRVSYPLGNFSTTGATTRPDLDLSQVPPLFRFFEGKDGFVKGLIPFPKNGLKWIDSVATLPITQKRKKEQLIGFYLYTPNSANENKSIKEQGLILWNDKSHQFEIITTYEDNSCLFPTKPACISNGARIAQLHYEKGDQKTYLYLGYPFAVYRCKPSLKSISISRNWASFTCFQEGSRYDSFKIERDGNGNVIWGWKKNTVPVTQSVQEWLFRENNLEPEQRYWNIFDPESGKRLLSQSGTMFWNNYKKKYISIIQQLNGTSFLGEIFYLDSNSFHGPWKNPIKIITHNKYSFYNVFHHHRLDKEKGKIIFIEGTFANTFSQTKHPVPKYNYNQIMYQLDLSDKRLFLKKNN